MKFKRIFLMVLDSLGVGEALDANNYDDNGANTLGHIRDNYDLFVPNLKKLGFLNTTKRVGPIMIQKHTFVPLRTQQY